MRSVEEQSLDDQTIFFCYQNGCVKISADGTLDCPGFANEYEEADYMFVPYPVIEEGKIMIRSPTGVVNIIGMLVGHMDKNNVTGKSREVFKLNSCTLSPEQRDAVMGVHAFSGNVYVSGFFRKGKKTFWHACKNVSFFSALSSFGTSYQIYLFISLYFSLFYISKKYGNHAIVQVY